MKDIKDFLQNSFLFKVFSPEKKSFFSAFFSIKKILKEEKPDILHLHGTRAAVWGRTAVIGLKRKPRVVYTLHGFHILHSNFLKRFLFLKMEKFLNKWTDVLVCVSEADKKIFLEKKMISADKVKVIKNGIEIAKFQISQEKVEEKRKELGLENSFVVSAVGRLHHQKDFFTAIRSLKILKEKIPELKLLIIGEGPQRERLEKEAEEVKDKIQFLGQRKDVPILLNVSDVVILPTNWEGLPLVSLEAGASGKPFLASNVGGVRETVVEEKTGFLFKPHSEKELAEKIFQLYCSPELRGEMGQNNFQFVSENFSREKMAQHYKNLYQSLL